MIFVDASALIAILRQEADADALADRLELDAIRTCSALSVWASVAGLCRSYGLTESEARADVARFLEAGDIGFVPIGERECEIALDAYARFGKGRHPAALNMGDCYAYACARANGARLLFKGDDFSRTDIESAWAWP